MTWTSPNFLYGGLELSESVLDVACQGWRAPLPLSAFRAQDGEAHRAGGCLKASSLRRFTGFAPRWEQCLGRACSQLTAFGMFGFWNSSTAEVHLTTFFSTPDIDSRSRSPVRRRTTGCRRTAVEEREGCSPAWHSGARRPGARRASRLRTIRPKQLRDVCIVAGRSE